MLNPNQNLMQRVIDTIAHVYDRRGVARFMQFALGILPHQVRILIDLGGNIENSDYQFRQRKYYAMTMLGVRNDAKMSQELKTECIYESFSLPGDPFDETGLKYLKPGQVIVEKDDKKAGIWYELGAIPAEMNMNQLKDMLKDIVYVLAMGCYVQMRLSVPVSHKVVKTKVPTKIVQVHGKFTRVRVPASV